MESPDLENKQPLITGKEHNGLRAGGGVRLAECVWTIFLFSKVPGPAGGFTRAPTQASQQGVEVI